MASNIGLSSVLDSVEFVRKAWGQLSLPSAFVPTMDVEELDRRIADLKTVEQWLNVNLSMLRGTVQGLEVQRNTVAAVKAMGSAMNLNAEQMKAGVASAVAAFPNMGFTGAAPQADPQARQATQPAPETPEPPGTSGSPGVFSTAGQTQPHADAAPVAARTAGAASTARRRSAKVAQAKPDTPASMIPSAWWNMLQEQFNQVASSALTGVGTAGKTMFGGDLNPLGGTPTRTPAGKHAADTPGSTGARKAGTARGGKAKAKVAARPRSGGRS